MGIYDRHLGQRFVRCLCAMSDISAEREKVVPRARGVVLEIGFGPGLNLPFYDPVKVERVIGVDPNDGFLTLGEAQSRCARVAIEICRAPAEALPLADASVDTAVITYTLCSVGEPMRARSEVKRALKPDGQVLFLEHGLSPDSGTARWQARINPIWRPVAVGCNLNRPTAAMLRQAGFVISELQEYYLPRIPRILGFHCQGVAGTA